MRKYAYVFALLFCFALIPAAGQSPAPAATGSVSRTTKAVNYRLRSGAVEVDLRGTELMANAVGQAKVEGKKSSVEIDAKFENLDDPTRFGLEFLTYVLWAVSPQGKAVKIGELVLDHTSSHVKAPLEMQTFGMIVTAEPYFAVNQPGNVVVMENIVPAGFRQENIDATYELLARGTYASTQTKIENAIFGIDKKTPRPLFQARNAVRIARNASADKYAAPILSKAEQQLQQAEAAYSQKQNKSAVETPAREAVETAEEARVMAVKKKAEEEAAAAAAAREAQAKALADAEAKRRADAEAARAQAEAAKADAERMKAAAEKAAQDAAQQREAAEKAKQEADAARNAAEAQQKVLAAETEKARRAAEESDRLRQQAEKDKADLRARLLAQLNTILATRDSARGLIANMSDVLFKTGSFELLPGARERLAKVSGIVLAYPGLHLDVEGHTDSVGGDEYNQQLSERRAGAVRDYLVQQGIPDGAIVFRGFGKTKPVASNDTPEGRQQNRRVELVISGDAIGGANTADLGGSGAGSPPPQQK
ncbi:MAG TPA: OmpA family protein [Candidatus Angelobacter sp.]|nr:OmpA family protein [Candidatus Angelobacter sp.]